MSLVDRKQCAELVRVASASGARRVASCEILCLSLRTLERWERQPDQADARVGPKTMPIHALSALEKSEIITTANAPEYRDRSPWQIVAKLADLGRYLASESSFYRVLKANDLLSHRSKSQPKKCSQPKALVAKNPNEVWSWDITYLKSPVTGRFYYLYLMVDIFSRMIVGWSVEEVESGNHAASLIEAACVSQRVRRGQVTLHSDNGSPMKGATMLSTLQWLGVIPSFSRPSVSDDNPFSESLFKTLKYCPSYPDGAFTSVEHAREWVQEFVAWYNTEHLHSAIRFVTPQARHEGADEALLKNRHSVYENAKKMNPSRWSRNTRNWTRIAEVHLNPKKEPKTGNQLLRNQAA